MHEALFVPDFRYMAELPPRRLRNIAEGKVKSFKIDESMEAVLKSLRDRWNLNDSAHALRRAVVMLATVTELVDKGLAVSVTVSEGELVMTFDDESDVIHLGEVGEIQDHSIDADANTPLTAFDEEGKELPKYKCHKVVWALPINILSSVTDGSGDYMMSSSIAGYSAIRLDRHFMEKHDPECGGYLVIYKDGYMSYSPKEAFEDGYSLIAY